MRTISLERSAAARTAISLLTPPPPAFTADATRYGIADADWAFGHQDEAAFSAPPHAAIAATAFLFLPAHESPFCT